MEKLVAYIAQVWFWPILLHKQSSNLEGSMGLFYELWSLVLSIDFLLDSSLGHSRSFTFFLWNQMSFLGCVFGIIVSLKCLPSFHLHHPGRWQQIFIKNVSVHFSIHPSFNYMNFASATPWCFGVMCSAIWPPTMVCIMASKEYNFCLIWPDYILPVFHRLV